MSRIRTRLKRLEHVQARRPSCPCQDPSGPLEFTVRPPRVIGQVYPEEPPRVPRHCERCGREIKDMVFVVRPPRAIGPGERG